MIGYGKQTIDKNDIRGVIDVLKSDNLTQGKFVTKFEKKLTKYFGANYASVVSSGTAALHLVAIALKWKKDDIIITSPLTFLASATTAYFVGAKVDLVDINPISYNLDIELLEEKIKHLKKNGKKLKAVVAVDYAGYPCNWKKLRMLANKYNFYLINDNCHAIGAKLNNSKKYASKYADIVTHSYHPVKNITTGEGGAVLTNSSKIDKKIKLLRSHNMIKNASTAKIGPWLYHIKEIGYNYRLTDMQCSLGISQLDKLDTFIISRQNIAKRYDKAFKNDIRFIIPKFDNLNVSHAYHLYPLQINFDRLKITKKTFFKKMRNYQINLQVHYLPLHMQPFFKKKLNYNKGDFIFSEQFYEREVSLPIFPNLKTIEQKKIIKIIKKLLR